MSYISSSFIRSLLTARIFNPSLPLYYHYLIMQPQFSNSLSSVDPKDIIAVDCEYVGTGPKGSVSTLGSFFFATTVLSLLSLFDSVQIF